MKLFLNNGSCVLTCATSYYDDLSSIRQCDVCDIACINCQAPNNNTFCSVCNNNQGYVMSSSAQNTCVQCSNSEIALGNPLQCTPCDSSCASCSGTVINCTSCSGNYLQPNSTFTCNSTCPDSYFGNATTWVCDSCDSTCLTCNSSLSTDCLSCGNNLYLNFNQSICTSACPNG